ncbi:MAG: MarR family winged helix-turn-helix transcriptional regulator [Syntrophothermaceae bacterium]|jgi:DNA-binding MarR family transcriptional regulator
MELEQCINFVLTKAQQAVHQLFKEELARFEVTPGQYAVLKCLWDENGQTARQLADRLYVDGSTMTGLLDRMERKGLVERHHNSKDRRALKVVLTNKGRELEEPLNQIIEDTNRKALQTLDDSEVNTLRKLLHNLEPRR